MNLENGLFIIDTKRLRKLYFKSKLFIFDVLSIFPTDIFYIIKGPDYAFLRVNRVLRIYRISTLFDKTDSRSNYPYVFRAAQLVLYLILSFHWNACFYYTLSSWLGFCTDQWVFVNSSCEKKYLDASGSDELLFIYTYCFYWSLLTLVALGDVNHPVKVLEFVIMVFQYLLGHFLNQNLMFNHLFKLFLLAGILLFATIIGNVSDIITSMNSEKTSLEEDIDGVKQYVDLRKVRQDIEKRVTKFVSLMLFNN